MSAAQPVPTGFRRDITLLHHLSDLMEKHPDLPRPLVDLRTNNKGQPTNEVRWRFSTDYNIRVPWYDENGDAVDPDERAEKEAGLRRVDLEERMAAVLTALGPDIEWEKNDPSVDEWSYTLTTTWHGATLRLSTWRDAVCEKVTVMEKDVVEEVPDPELVKNIPLVTVTRKEPVTEWQCNERLAAATAPRHIRKVEVLS